MSRILKCRYARNPQAWLMAATLMRGSPIDRHPGESRDLPQTHLHQIPACAGMTNVLTIPSDVTSPSKLGQDCIRAGNIHAGLVFDVELRDHALIHDHGIAA